MIRAVNAWAIFHPAQGLLLHAIDANQRGAWAMLNLHHHPDEPMRSEEERIALGFRYAFYPALRPIAEAQGELF